MKQLYIIKIELKIHQKQTIHFWRGIYFQLSVKLKINYLF